MCGSRWGRSGGRSVNLPGELRHQHGETSVLGAAGVWSNAPIILLLLKGSREQLAIAEFARSLLVIPKTLAVNAAQDSTDLVAKLRAFHNEAQVNPERKNLKW